MRIHEMPSPVSWRNVEITQNSLLISSGYSPLLSQDPDSKGVDQDIIPLDSLIMVEAYLQRGFMLRLGRMLGIYKFEGPSPPVDKCVELNLRYLDSNKKARELTIDGNLVSTIEGVELKLESGYKTGWDRLGVFFKELCTRIPESIVEVREW